METRKSQVNGIMNVVPLAPMTQMMDDVVLSEYINFALSIRPSKEIALKSPVVYTSDF